MADVFISYASEDRERAKCSPALRAFGWSVWWDRRIIAGQTFDRAIERELETARSVVVVWSEHSIVSESVKSIPVSDVRPEWRDRHRSAEPQRGEMLGFGRLTGNYVPQIFQFALPMEPHAHDPARARKPPFQ